MLPCPRIANSSIGPTGWRWANPQTDPVTAVKLIGHLTWFLQALTRPQQAEALTAGWAPQATTTCLEILDRLGTLPVPPAKAERQLIRLFTKAAQASPVEVAIWWTSPAELHVQAVLEPS
jgi:hypothetical protein